MQGTIRRGDKGDVVLELQRRLIQLGYMASGSDDGDFGPQTEAALKRFQAESGLEQSGVAEEKTWNAFYSRMGDNTGGQPAAPQGGGGGGGSWRQSIESDPAYSYLQVFLDVPELSSLMQQAVENKWSQELFTQHLRGTDYWKSNDQKRRQWDTIGQADKENLVREESAAVYNKMVEIFGRPWMSAHGIASEDAWEVKNRANQIASGQTTEEYMFSQLMQDALKDPSTDQFITEQDKQSQMARKKKSPEEYAETLYQDARTNFWVPITKDDARQYANRIFDGSYTYSQFSDEMRAKAKGLYPALSRQIDAGINPKQIFSPYTQLASKELEMDPDSLILDDSVFGEITRGASTGDFPSMYDFRASLRKMPQYRKTIGAHDLAASFGAKVLHEFGLEG